MTRNGRVLFALFLALCAGDLVLFGLAVADTFAGAELITGNPVFGFVCLPAAAFMGFAAYVVHKEFRDE